MLQCVHDACVQVKIWFQNHRYKTKKALKEESHAEHRAAVVAADAVMLPGVDGATSPRKATTAPTLHARNGTEGSPGDDDDDDVKRIPLTSDVLPADLQRVVPTAPSGLVFRTSSADLRPGRFPTSMYPGQTQSPTPPMFSASTGFHDYPGRRQDAAAARPPNRSPDDSSPSPFGAAADPGLASVLYGHRDTSTAAAAGPMGYYYHHPAHSATTNNAFDRHITTSFGYLPISGLRSW